MKQRLAIVLSLENETLYAVLELGEEMIPEGPGVDAIINRLDRMYKKDETLENYMVSEIFKHVKDEKI